MKNVGLIVQFVLLLCLLLTFGLANQAVADDVYGKVVSGSTIEDVDLDDAIGSLVYRTYERIHQYPELGKQETKTQTLILGELQKLGFQEFHQSLLAPTAVIAVLDTGRPGPTVALRAEMDARKIDEAPTNVPRSKIDGIMHNCGHDAHSAMLLGSAAYLIQHKEAISGRVVFIFQPAEETRGGADDLVNEGLLEKLGVQAIFAQHVFSEMPVGTISIAPGANLAGSNYFTLTVRGAGSHGALPSGGGDTLVAAAKILADLSELPARRLHIVNRPVIISPTQITSDSQSSNVVPSAVEIKGTIRAFENLLAPEDGDESVDSLIRNYLDGAAKAYGVTYELDVRKGAPPTINDMGLFNSTIPVLRKSWPGSVKTDLNRGMFSEDFAYYTEQVPALYFGLGIQRDSLGRAGVHTAEFNIHPDALSYGVRLLVNLAQLYTVGSVSP